MFLLFASMFMSCVIIILHIHFDHNNKAQERRIDDIIEKTNGGSDDK